MGLVALYQLVAVVLATLVIASLAFLFGLLGWQRLAYTQVRAWARALHLATGVRPRGHGLENVPTTGSTSSRTTRATWMGRP